jgi:hypothetical protein
MVVSKRCGDSKTIRPETDTTMWTKLTMTLG